MLTPHTQDNLEAFFVELSKQYAELFKSDPDYAYAATQKTPEAMARSMALGLACGKADKGGKGVINTCRVLGIKHTYAAIREFINGK